MENPASFPRPGERNNPNPERRYLLTVNGFKRLCMAAETDKAKRVREYYITMESVLLEYTRQLADEAKQAAEKAAEDAQRAAAEKDQELEEARRDAEEQAQIIEDMKIEMMHFQNQAVMYMFHTEPKDPNSYKRMGITEHVGNRVKPYRQTAPNGRVTYFEKVPLINLKSAETFLHSVLGYHDHRISQEVFDISTKDASNWLSIISTMFDIKGPDYAAKLDLLARAANFVRRGGPNPLAEFQRAVTEEDLLDPTPAIMQAAAVRQADALAADPASVHVPTGARPAEASASHNFGFDKFIAECCEVDPRGETPTVAIAGAYRIWARCARKDAYHALLEYLATRFRPTRLQAQVMNTVVNGYRGVRLKPREAYVLPAAPTDVECFLHQVCHRVPHGKVHLYVLRDEFARWRTRVHGSTTNEDLTRLRAYLNNSPDFVQAMVFVRDIQQQGYWGLCLKSEIREHRTPGRTSKTVYKLDSVTGAVVEAWPSVARAAEAQGWPACKMSAAIHRHTEQPGNFVFSFATGHQ